MSSWERKVGFADHYGTSAEVHFTPADEDGDALLGLTLRTGGATISGYLTPEATRQLAASLLDGADSLDANRDPG